MNRETEPFNNILPSSCTAGEERIVQATECLLLPARLHTVETLINEHSNPERLDLIENSFPYDSISRTSRHRSVTYAF